ncbi:MAG: translation elongation factor Ts, partial [Clostridia bacterium]|nr:translation elongation factor Ts [Clostridia bacterium]
EAGCDCDKAKAVIHDVAMHIAAAKPTALSREDVDQADIEKEREILKAQALNEPKPKPINIIEKMVEGRIAKYFKEVCLLEQPFVKDPDQSVAQMLGDVEIKSFVRFEMGEGLEKRQDNFAEEVMGQMKK